METITRTTCRIDNEELIELFDLGNIYLSGFPKAGEESRLPKVPLTLCMGKKSKLIQLKHTAPSAHMYEEYWYRSGINQTMTNELKSIVESVMQVTRLDEGEIVVDVGCNDGTLIKHYSKNLTRVGFDPAKNLYQFSSQHTTKTIVNYFNAKEYFAHLSKKAKVLTSIAMFYDLEDPNSFVKDVYDVLDDNGLWIIQMSYLPLMLKQMAFDNICHEHLEYYSLKTLQYLLSRNGFRIVDCILNDINGGSFRIYIQKTIAKKDSFATTQFRDVADMRVESILHYEELLRLDDPQTYFTYFKEMEELKTKTLKFLAQEKAKGKKIWGYGASTKGNTLLQWYGITPLQIEKIAERNQDKFGRVTIGTNIPIVSEEECRKERPDYLLVLPWHFRDEFVRREKSYLEQGGKFIFPLPQFEVVGIEDL